jgi:hypothetical protein
MKRGALLAVAGVLALGMASVAVGSEAGTAAPLDELTGAVGQPVTLDGEQAHTVVRAERWWGGGTWVLKPGEAAVTVYVNVRALAGTTVNPLSYGVRGADGKTRGRVVFGSRGPGFSSGTLAAGAVAEGWLTFVVPETDIDGLTLVYRMRSGFGSTLLVPLGQPTPSPTAALKKPVALEGEQVHTVTKVERWPGSGMWKPKKGSAYVTVLVRVKALKATTIGRAYYTVRTRAGKEYGRPLVGTRTPDLPFEKALAAGRTVEGWVTLMVPTAQLGSLTLIYHLGDGDGPTLLVPLPVAR